MEKILYLFDPLCGWYYGASQEVQRLAETAEVELVPTGLFSPFWAENGHSICRICVGE
ncbi:hypothetical protein [Haemophilus paracuniculus]|uniref:hypothetical protein n=1 Tax=Haemophilus paracuniculus TaxID=734 RepID=UPI0013015C06|nr:hypothetical protein [Haemophilus paracuniculus]